MRPYNTSVSRMVILQHRAGDLHLMTALTNMGDNCGGLTLDTEDITISLEAARGEYKNCEELYETHWHETRL